ncbi:MAG: ribonuclease HI family protein [Candidatus Falkowbacteria bacterium]
MHHKKIIIYTDGGARGNPGPAGIGVAIYTEDKEIIEEHSDFLGIATNNQAEYKAVILALKKAHLLEAEEIHFFLDSELVVKQLRGEYKVKNQDLASLYLEIHNLSIHFKKISYTHVRRELNKEADRLANEAMDRGGNI